MGHFKKFKKAKIFVDPTLPNHEEYPYDDLNNWHNFYPDAHYALPPKGKPVRVTIWVDADHARDKVTCRSVSDIIMMVNSTVVRTFSKRHSTVESFTYGSELVAS